MPARAISDSETLESRLRTLIEEAWAELETAAGAARTRHGMEQHARALHRYCELLYISSRFMAEGIVPDERQLSRTTRGEPRRA